MRTVRVGVLALVVVVLVASLLVGLSSRRPSGPTAATGPSSTDLRAIERLRDKQYRRWRVNQRRWEAAELDDLITVSHVRRLLGLATE